MKINKRVQLSLLFLLLLLCVWNIITDLPDRTEKTYNISLVIRGKMDDSWSNLKKGAENAAEDLNVNLRFVAAIEGNTAEEQSELLEKEMDGTDAIIVSPVNRTLLKDQILSMVKRKKPVILIESGISGKNSVPIIQSDNVAMGKTLAQSIINHGVHKKKILIFSGNGMYSSVIDRQKGFMEAMEETENQCTIVSAGNFEPEGMYHMFRECEPDVAVALDTKLLENLVRAKEIYQEQCPDEDVSLYGAGCSSTVLKDLENQDIVAITAEDDFAIGYLSVQEAVNAIQGKKTESNSDIRYILTHSLQMYNDTNQRLLFPFVK